MDRVWKAAGIRTLLAAFSLLPVSLAGCGNFFQCDKTSCPTTTGTASGSGTSTAASGDYAYLANSAAGTTYLSEYAISSSSLTSLGSLQLGYIPVALAVAPSNAFLYVASVSGATSPGIYLYSIGSTGALTAANSGNSLAVDTVSSMAISPDGNWLFTVNIDGVTMSEYKVNTSTGALTLNGSLSLLGTPCNLTAAIPVSQSCSVTVSQSGAYVVASTGISGELVYPYNSANGITGSGVYSISSGYSTGNPVGDFSAAVNSSNYAYVAQTNSVAAYGLLTAGGYSSYGTVSYATGSAPRSIVLNPAGTFVFTANESASTISGFSVVSGGGLNAVSGSPTPGPPNVSAISVDNTGGYLVGVGYDANTGIRLYTVSSAGVLTQVAQVGSGTNEAYPALVAMTH